MGLAQLRGHSSLVIKVSKAAVRVEGASIQNGLGGLLDFCFLGVGGRGLGEVVVNYILGIAIVAFNTPADSSSPSHMYIRHHNTKMIYLSSRNRPCLKNREG